MSQVKSHNKAVLFDLKRKHGDAESKNENCPVPLSSIPVPPNPSKKPNSQLQTKKICLSLPNKSLTDSTKHETVKLQPVSVDVAKVFGQEEEIEEEEMPVEARIRMRNKGRETPTSSGPNSYGKSRYGFIDRRALLNKQLEALNEQVSGDNEDTCSNQ